MADEVEAPSAIGQQPFVDCVENRVPSDYRAETLAPLWTGAGSQFDAPNSDHRMPPESAKNTHIPTAEARGHLESNLTEPSRRKNDASSQRTVHEAVGALLDDVILFLRPLAAFCGRYLAH